jgi:xanthine dehydrogenase accessory factor
MMLVFADGTQSGTLGGGCVEAEVKKRALAALANGREEPELHSFVLDDDYGWGDGLICGGQMTVVVEPIVSQGVSSSNIAKLYYGIVKMELDAGRGFTQVIALSDNRLGARPGERALFKEDNSPRIGRDEMELLEPKLPPRAFRTQPCVIEGCAVLPTQAGISLLIIGAGHVGQAVAAYAHDLDFDVWVLDDRDKFANAERFPHASRRLIGDIGRELQALKSTITPSTYCLIVTRGHSHDEEALYHVATSDAGYIGMIGSKRKVRLIFDDLRAKGISDETLARVRAPIGLDIGSQTVPEIAISILAELIACRNLGASPKNPPAANRGFSFKE